MISRRFAAAMLMIVMSVGVGSALADEKEEKIPYSALPEKVRQAFEKDYPGVKVKRVEKETHRNGAVRYEIEYIDKDGDDEDVEYDANGKRLDDDDD